MPLQADRLKPALNWLLLQYEAHGRLSPGYTAPPAAERLSLGRRDEGTDTSDLSDTLNDIEALLDSGTYQPGPWADFLRVAEKRPRAERAALAPAVTRISDKLHQRKHTVRFPVWAGLATEVIGIALGFVLLQIGLDQRSSGLVVASSLVLTATLQPPIKIAVGYLAGVRYSYFFLFGIEPRFKMRYGTYLAIEPWRRVLLHLAGTVGSPLAFWWAAVRAEEVLPGASATCKVFFLVLVAIQAATFLLGLAGVRRLGPLGAVRNTSGGGAAYELRRLMSS